MKRLIKVLSILLPITLVGLSITGLVLSNDKQEVSATNAGDTSYQTFIFYDENLSHDEYKVAFTSRSDHGDVDSMIKYDLKHVCDYVHVVTLPTSITKTYMKFYYSGNNGYTRNGGNNATMYFNTSSTGYISNSNGRSIKYLNSSASTRRLWFAIPDITEGCFPTLRISDGNKYVMNKIHNFADTRDYYFVDVPMSITEYGIQYVSSDASYTAIISTASRSNEFMHTVKKVNGSSLEDIDSNTTFDYFIINEYLKGFVSCSSSDINGYGAFPYIKTMYEKLDPIYVGSLDTIYQDDYEQSDFVNGEYLVTSIREGESVTALEKYNQLYYMSSGRQSKLFVNPVSNMNIAVIVFISIFACSTIVVYILLRRKTVH